MNSIKNAVVTVALLIVGYGSYIVLKEPELGTYADPQGAPSDSVSLDADPAAQSDAGLPEIEISVDIDTPELAEVSPPVATRQVAPVPSVDHAATQKT